MQTTKRVIAVNAQGVRIGEDHQNAKLTNAEVERIRDLRASGLTYGAIAKKFEVSRSAIARICRYEFRASTAAGYRTISYSKG